MSEYLLTLAGVSILSGVVTMLGADGGMKNYIRLVCSLSVLCVLISPLITLAAGGELSLDGLWDSLNGEEIDYEEIYKESLESYEIETANQYLKRSIKESLSVDPSDFDVSIQTVSKNGITEAESVWVILRDKGVLADPDAIVSLVNSQLKCPAIIVYE